EKGRCDRSPRDAERNVDREEVAEHRGNGGLKAYSEKTARSGAQHAESECLHDVDGTGACTSSTEAAKDGDGFESPAHVKMNRTADPESAEKQRSERDESEE